MDLVLCARPPPKRWSRPDTGCAWRGYIIPFLDCWRFRTGYGTIRNYTYEKSSSIPCLRTTPVALSLRRGPCRGSTLRLPLPPDCHNRYHGDERQDLDREFHLVVPLGGRDKDRNHYDCEYPHRRPRDIERISHDDAGSLYNSTAFASDGGCGVYALRHRNDLGGPQAAPECGHPIRHWRLHQLVPRTPPFSRRELRCIQRNERKNVCLSPGACAHNHQPEASRENYHRKCNK